jgi:transcriptional regulator with XRE-family HTH domain
MPTTGDRIREVREKTGMTQAELAEKAHVSKGFLSDVENNKRNVSAQVLLRIANALGASLDFLLRGTEEEPEAPRGAVTIPPSLSRAAEELDLSYSQTLELLDTHKSIVARRSNRSVKELTVQDWKNLYNAVKKVFG